MKKEIGKGKEYYKDGKIRFQCEYINDIELNGNIYNYNNDIDLILKNNINGIVSSYYDNGKLKFESEYLNGKRNRKGKEYYKDGKLKLESEYLNDLKWNGKGYDLSNNIIYELINGCGKVKEYWTDGILFFEGEYLNGKRNGKGTQYWLNG